MDKNDIIEYVMHTPHNTNKAVLSSMLNEISSDGSGGSSDFSTAIVNITYVPPEGQEVQAILEVSVSSIYNDNEAIHYTYNANGLPTSEIGTPTQMNVPLYKELPSDFIVYMEVTEGDTMMDIENSEVVSGDAVIDLENGKLLISGDCTLKLALTLMD